MNSQTDVVFLGVNDAGMRVYEWLCDCESVFVHALVTTKDQLRLIESAEPEFIVSCGHRHIVPEEILEIPTKGALNLHSSYLPYNRGANPNVWSIIEDTPAGVTLHYMDASIDTGPIVAQTQVQYDFADTGKDLYERLEQAQVDLFKETWPAIEAGEIDPTEQDTDAGTYHESDEFEQLCELDPEKEYETRELLDRLRALTFPPYDNTYLEINGERYYIDIKIRQADTEESDT